MGALTTRAYVAALKAEGCHVVAWDGWTTRDRPGPWSPRGVIIHHTGPPTDVATMRRILRFGRPGLPGPLCHVGGRPDGTLDLVGWHDANHGGLGDPAVLAAVERDQVPPSPRRGHDTADGNAAFYGVELIHDGTRSMPWPDDQVEAAVRFSAAVCRAHGWSPNRVIYHKGWTTRKVDPGGTFPSITAFRERVAERLRRAASWSPGDTDPQLTDTTEDETMFLIIRAPGGRWYHLTNGHLIQLGKHAAESTTAFGKYRLILDVDDAAWKRYRSAFRVVDRG